MATNISAGLARLMNGHTCLGLSETDLLARFVALRDEVAFEAIVQRHGPMVLRVCRGILLCSADADDAFQATFLVLVRKADTLRDGEHLSAWLHGVARRVALQAKTNANRRRHREVLGVVVEPMALDSAECEVNQHELAAIIHAEIDRLSGPERAAVVLCDLEGLSHQVAAVELGWPVGTVKTRVARGRARLRARLIRRGLTLPAGWVVGNWALESAGGAVFIRAALVVQTARVAVLFAAGRLLGVGLVPVPVLILSQGVLRTMMITKLKFAACSLVASAGILVIPGFFAAAQGPGVPATGATSEVTTLPPPLKPYLAPVPSPNRNGSPPSLEGEAPILGLRRTLAEKVVKMIEANDHNNQPVAADFRLLWYQRLAEAELEPTTLLGDQILIVKRYVARIQQFADRQTDRIVANMTRELSIPFLAGATSEWNQTWDEVTNLTETLTRAKGWLAQLEAAQPTEPAAKSSESQPRTEEDPRPAQVIASESAPNPSSPGRGTPDEQRTKAILEVLAERVSMPFPNPTPIEDVLKYVKAATVNQPAGFPAGIQIYVNPEALKAADKTLASTVSINLEGVPLWTTLTLVLKQLGLGIAVEDGLIRVDQLDPQLAGPSPLPFGPTLQVLGRDQKQNEAIVKLLEVPVDLSNPDGVWLHDLLKRIQMAAHYEVAGKTHGLPIYLDPEALTEAGANTESRVIIDLKGIPLRTTLRLVLSQLHLRYVVDGGVLLIVAEPDSEGGAFAPSQSAKSPQMNNLGGFR